MAIIPQGCRRKLLGGELLPWHHQSVPAQHANTSSAGELESKVSPFPCKTSLTAKPHQLRSQLHSFQRRSLSCLNGYLSPALLLGRNLHLSLVLNLSPECGFPQPIAGPRSGCGEALQNQDEPACPKIFQPRVVAATFQMFAILSSASAMFKWARTVLRNSL